MAELQNGTQWFVQYLCPNAFKLICYFSWCLFNVANYVCLDNITFYYELCTCAGWGEGSV